MSVAGRAGSAITRSSRGERVTVTGLAAPMRVHALGQVAHFDVRERTSRRERCADALKPLSAADPVVVLESDVAMNNSMPDFPRRARHYLFRFEQPRAPALETGQGMACQLAMDAERCTRRGSFCWASMIFTTFRAAECQAQSPVKTWIGGCVAPRR